MIKVLIVDDHAVFREGLKKVLQTDPDIEVVGDISDGKMAVKKAVELKPDVILMDIVMPYSGLHAAMDVLQKLPDMKILMLTVSEQYDDLYEAVKIGAHGYLLKGIGIDELISSVKSVADGGAVFTPSMAIKLLENIREAKPNGKNHLNLTDREREILRLVASGASNKEISQQLYLSEPTVKAHLRNILGKLHLKNRSQAAVYAARTNLLGNNPVDSN